MELAGGDVATSIKSWFGVLSPEEAKRERFFQFKIKFLEQHVAPHHLRNWVNTEDKWRDVDFEKLLARYRLTEAWKAHLAGGTW